MTGSVEKIFLSLYLAYFDESSTEIAGKNFSPLGNAMGLFDLNFTDSESDSAVSDGEEQIALKRSKNPIASNPEPTTDTSSTEPKGNDVKMQETFHKQEDEVADDVEDEEDEEELPLRRPNVVKETAKPTAAAAASTTTKAKAKDVEMEGNFNKYGKWKREEREEFVPCTLSFGCILEARHADICFCPVDQSKSRSCKPTSFAPPTRRVQRHKKRAKTDKTDTVVLAAVEIPAPAPQVEVPSSDDEDRIVASLVSLKKGPTTSSSVMTMRTESTGASSAGPSTVTTEDNIKQLAKLLASLPEEDSKIELELMHAIAKKYQLQPGIFAK